jgi:hypothetical protein
MLWRQRCLRQRSFRVAIFGVTETLFKASGNGGTPGEIVGRLNMETCRDNQRHVDKNLLSIRKKKQKS